MKTYKILLISIFAFFVFIPFVNGAISYTETMEKIDESGWGGVWNNDQDCGSAPANSVAEIIAVNPQTGQSIYAGARESTHYYSQRYVVLHEAEGGGNTTSRFIVPIDADGECDFYGTLADYYLIGYWEGISFTEDWELIEVSSAQDNMWHERDLDTEGTGQAESVYVLTFVSDKTNAGRFFGTRNTTSSLDRYVDVHEAEPSGENCYTMFVMTDAGNSIDIYIEEYDEGHIYGQGHFGTDLDFQEAWTLDPGTGGTWADWDLTSSLDQDERVVDIVMMHDERASTIQLGGRENGDSSERYIVEHEAESTGWSGFSMSVQTDASGIIELYDQGQENYFSGYFIWEIAVVNVVPVNDALIIANMDDTDDLMAERKNYYFFYDGHDDNGYADINRVYIRVKQGNTTRMEAWFDEDTNGWLLSSGNWELNLGACNYTKSGNNLNLTFAVYPSWDATEEQNIELEAKIWDDEPTSDTDVMQTDYADVIVTIRTSSMECTDGNDPDRVDVGINSTTNFGIRYIIEPFSVTTGTYYPPDSEFDYVAIYDSLNNDEVRDYTIVNGDGSGDFFESTVQSETYNLYVNLDDPDWIDKEIAGETETIIWDRLNPVIYPGVTQTESGNTVKFWLNVTYAYDSGSCTTWEVDIKRNATNDWQNDLTYSAGNPDFTDSSGSPITYAYDIVQDVSETTYGLTVFSDVTEVYVEWTIIGSVPINDDLIFSDFLDSDNLYAEKEDYDLEYDGHDPDGFGNINRVYVRVKQGNTTRMEAYYDEDTNTFALVSGNWEINVGGSSYNKAGNNLNLTFKVYPSWDAIEEADFELEAKIWDGDGNSDTDVLQTDYGDVITNLLTSSIECVDPDDPDRVDVGLNETTDFVLRYADNPGSGSASSYYPPDSEFDYVAIWDSSDNEEVRDYTIVNGAGSEAFFESTVQSENYNLYVNMDDADYTDGEEAPIETIIWDTMNVTIFSVNNTTPELDETVQFSVSVRYVYDGVLVSGTYDIERNSSLWINDRAIGLNFTDVNSSEVVFVYDIEGFVDSNYGLTTYIDAEDLTVTWSEVLIFWVYDPQLLFGAGFIHQNNVTGFVLIYWNDTQTQDSNVTYEIQVSYNVNPLSWNYLDRVSVQNYNHSGLNASMYRWYRVRASLWETGVGWNNSGFTNVNLEQVYFGIVTGGVNLLDALDINWFLMILWLGLLSIGFVKDGGNDQVKTFAGLIGILFGLFFFPENAMITIALVFFNTWVLWDGVSR